MIKRITFASFCYVITVTALLTSCGKEEEQPEIIRPVRYIQVFATGGTRERTFSGVTQAGLESRLSFKVPGTVSRVAVKVGDKVSAGDLIARLDRSDYQLKVQQAEAALENVKAQARNAQANYDRVRALWENKGASKTDLDAARAASESTEASVKSAEKQLELAQLQLRYTTLTAPVSGAIAQANVEVNENVGAGKTIVVLTSGSQIEVKISVPEILISQVREGSAATVTCDAYPGKELSATITEVGVASTGMVTTFPVTVRLDKPAPDIRPGMAATVAFHYESKDQRERFLVPSIAVGEDRDGRFVYVVEPLTEEPGFGTVRRRAVAIGELTREGIEVFEGLADGDLVITAGISRIIDGQKVKI
ncbi:MAG: efflux RND transporter periplasmic adaptor subunit [bacterium]|nr:MAG: efflux RND transporter periplasmic adaptor subunit [bacterium]